MPPAPKRPCTHPGCQVLTTTGRCEAHQRDAWAKRPDAADAHRLRGRAGVERRRRWLAQYPLCRMCDDDGVTTLGTVVDHVIPLAQDGEDNESNLQTLCDEHHYIKSLRERGYRPRPTIGLDGLPTDPSHPWNSNLSAQANERRFPSGLNPSVIPLTMLCGPPASGKSTYLRAHVGLNDVVIDLDQITQRLSGLPEHHTGSKWVAQALDERNRQLRALAHDSTHERAWFVIAAPDPTERAQWAKRLGAQVVLLDTPLEECIRRILADPSRKGQTDRMVKAATDWWSVNQ